MIHETCDRRRDCGGDNSLERFSYWVRGNRQTPLYHCYGATKSWSLIYSVDSDIYRCICIWIETFGPLSLIRTSLKIKPNNEEENSDYHRCSLFAPCGECSQEVAESQSIYTIYDCCFILFDQQKEIRIGTWLIIFRNCKRKKTRQQARSSALWYQTLSVVLL